MSSKPPAEDCSQNRPQAASALADEAGIPPHGVWGAHPAGSVVSWSLPARSRSQSPSPTGIRHANYCHDSPRVGQSANGSSVDREGTPGTHEFGHTYGLRHAGGNTCTTTPVPYPYGPARALMNVPSDWAYQDCSGSPLPPYPDDRNGVAVIYEEPKTNRARMIALVSALAVATAASRWLIARSNRGSSDEPYRLFGDYEVYPSVESLAEAADLVIEAEVGPVVLREVDRGGDPEIDPETGEKIPGVPMVFSEVTIVNVLRASSAVEAQARPDGSGSHGRHGAARGRSGVSVEGGRTRRAAPATSRSVDRSGLDTGQLPRAHERRQRRVRCGGLCCDTPAGSRARATRG